MSEPVEILPFPAVRDFPDRWPAMVVKELRQGLRARLFGETVAGFHLVLLVLLLPLCGFFDISGEAPGIQRLVWWILATVLVFLLPLRGLSSMAGERKADTLDTLLLTNLKAGRIVRGKWLAIASQITLVGISVLPYVLMLYAAGGLSLPESVMALLRLVAAGLLLTAAHLAFSWNESWLQRSAPGMAMAFFAMSFYAWPLTRGLLGQDSGPDSLFSAARIAAELTGAAALTYVLLETTARRLAPAGEDHHTGPRLVALLFPWTGLLIPHPLTGQISLMVMVLVSLNALTEPWPPAGPPGQAHRRRPGFGAGWPHGVLWAAAAWLSAFAALSLTQPPMALTAVRLAAWLFCGRILLGFSPSSWRGRPWWLAGTALVFGLAQALLLLADQLLGKPVLAALAAAVPAPLPVSGAGLPSPTLPWIALAAAGVSVALAGIRLAKNKAAGKEASA